MRRSSVAGPKTLDGGEAIGIDGSLVRMLRAATAASHERVENGLDLLAPDLSAARLAAVLARLAAFWATAEAGVDAWAAREPDVAASLDWPARRRTPLLVADVAALGGTVVAQTGPYRPHRSAEVFGWLYVAEGSTLGGALVARHLAARPQRFDVAPRSFTPYPDGPGPRWRAYGHAVDAWSAADSERAAAVVAAGAIAFAALERWCEPVFAGRPVERPVELAG